MAEKETKVEFEGEVLESFRSGMYRIGLDNAWPGQPSNIPRARLLGPSDLDSLARLGFRFGSHGLSHARFDRLGSTEPLAVQLAPFWPPVPTSVTTLMTDPSGKQIRPAEKL